MAPSASEYVIYEIPSVFQGWKVFEAISHQFTHMYGLATLFSTLGRCSHE